MTEHTAPTSGSALWVYAHPRATSLNARLFRAGREALAESRSVAISDFYAQRFDPVLRISDLGDASDTPGSIVEQAGAAYASGTLPVDIREEQRKLTEAELLVLQFPLWWFGVPAILKGWFDRVFTDGFAFGGTDPELGVPRRYGDGPLAGRRALIVVTAGEDPGSIGARGISGDLESLLFPLTHGTLWYAGIASHALHVVHDADGLDPDGAEREATRLQERLRGLESEPTLAYRRLRDGDYRGNRALRQDLAPGRTDFGIHLHD